MEKEWTMASDITDRGKGLTLGMMGGGVFHAKAWTWLSQWQTVAQSDIKIQLRNNENEQCGKGLCVLGGGG